MCDQQKFSGDRLPSETIGPLTAFRMVEVVEPPLYVMQLKSDKNSVKRET